MSNIKGTIQICMRVALWFRFRKISPMKENFEGVKDDESGCDFLEF